MPKISLTKIKERHKLTGTRRLEESLGIEVTAIVSGS